MQGMDLDSAYGVEDHAYQTITIETTGEYLLKIGWMIPTMSSLGRVTGIKVNSVFVANITIINSNSSDQYA